jgi:glycosyltransferase involved in cell wall biosynthesis
MTEAIPISVVVMTKNEERNVVSCLEALREFEQVFVVDSGSSDRTVELANELGARVVDFEWNGHYPKKKQWALDNLPFSQAWVFYVDADEVVQPQLRAEIRKIFGSPRVADAYVVGLDYVFGGRRLRFGQRVHKVALFRRSAARFIDADDLHVDNMWEVEGHYQPAIAGRVAHLEGRLLHNDHDSLFSYFQRHNRYSDWEAALSVDGALVDPREGGERVHKLAKRLFHRLPGRPAFFFVYSYVFRLGFLDGVAGLNYAIAKSFYYWQVQLKARELARGRRRVE